MVTNNKVVNFPPNKSELYDRAVDAFNLGQLQKALNLSISLIDAGDGHASALAGMIYEKGDDEVKKDIEKAIFYYEQSINEVGAVSAWLGLGRIYYFGKDVPIDYEKALYYYSVVVEDTENHIAYLMLGKMYLEGTGVQKNLIKAREYFEKAIKKGAVFGYTYLAMLEQEQGHILKSLFLRLKAGLLALWITRQNPSDSRLRRY